MMQLAKKRLFTLLAALVKLDLALGDANTAQSVGTKTVVGLTMDQCLKDLNGQLPSNPPSDFHFSGVVRTYYIQSEQVTWDYIPTGWDNWLGVPIEKSPRAQEAGYVEAGWKWEKAVYRGYTNASFTEKTPQPDWQGINGPTMRAEVGDMIQILFVNNLTSHYSSMHSMGLAYNKDNEGSLYPNTTTGGSPTVAPGDAVPPGGCDVYKWLINNASAPDPGLNSKLFAYHSYISLFNDLNAGLQGPTIVYNRGTMNETMASNREFVLLYEGFDESGSFLASENAEIHHLQSLPTPNTATIAHAGNISFWKPQVINMPNVTIQAPTFWSLNGWVFANNPAFEMCLDDNVVWYVYAMGSDTHVFHMHGNGFQYMGLNMASLHVSPGMMLTLPMVARSGGIWQLICHMADHLNWGMVGLYEVFWNLTGSACPLPKLEKN